MRNSLSPDKSGLSTSAEARNCSIPANKSKVSPEERSLFSRFLSVLRADRKYSGYKLADDIGITRPQFYRIEDSQRKPNSDLVRRISNTLNLDEIEDAALHSLATDPDAQFAPGIDRELMTRSQLECNENVREVYISSQGSAEINYSGIIDNVANALRDNEVSYHYLLPDKDKADLLISSLEKKAGQDILQKKLTCHVASNPFVFLPGFMILRLNGSPIKTIGLFEKTHQGIPCRVYQMDDANALEIYDKLQIIHRVLQDRDAYDSEYFGKVTKVYPNSPDSTEE